MDPITTAIVAGVVAGATKVATQGVADAYNGLKDLLKKKLGAQSEVVKAVEGVEAKPESAGRKETLKEEIASAKADQDAELLKAAQALLEKLKAQPDGAQIIQQATGSYIAQASGGGTATVSVNVPKP